MRFKKRYLVFGFIGTLLLSNQMGCMTARKTEAEQRKIVVQKGCPAPHFGTYKVAGRNIHYTHTGPDSLPLVVLVHGSPGSSADMLDYLTDTTLTRYAQVVAIDRPGFGYSDFGKAERSLKIQAAVLVPLAEKFHARKMILMGHSYGGPVIVRFAIDHPELTAGLVVVAGSVDPELEPSTWWKVPFNWPVLRWLVPSALRISNREILPLRSELEKMKPDWNKLTCPVIVYQGTSDNLVPAGNGDFLEKMAINSDTLQVNMLENDNHFILWSKEQMIANGIIELLENRN